MCRAARVTTFNKLTSQAWPLVSTPERLHAGFPSHGSFSRHRAQSGAVLLATSARSAPAHAVDPCLQQGLAWGWGLGATWALGPGRQLKLLVPSQA